jgi:hypothetical protein
MQQNKATHETCVKATAIAKRMSERHSCRQLLANALARRRITSGRSKRDRP